MGRRKRNRKSKKTSGLGSHLNKRIKLMRKRIKNVQLQLLQLCLKCTLVKNKICMYLVTKLYDPCRRFILKIVHIIEYFPKLWNDHHWDYSCLFSLIDFKLRKMEEVINKNNLIADADHVCKSIRVCRKLLKRSQCNSTHSNIQKMALERKWGKAIWFEPSKLMNESKDFEVVNKLGRPIGVRYTFFEAPEEVIKNGQYQEYCKDRSNHWKKEQKNRDKDLKLAFKVFQKYYNSWWD